MNDPNNEANHKYNPYDRPIPGASLTVEPGTRPWEQPPEFTVPDDFLEYLMDKFTEEKAAHRAYALMEAGMTIESIVKTVMTAAFTEGKVTPDVALLAAGPFSGFLKLMADDAGIDVTVMEERPDETDLADLMAAVKGTDDTPEDPMAAEDTPMDQGPPPEMGGGLMGPIA